MNELNIKNDGDKAISIRRYDGGATIKIVTYKKVNGLWDETEIELNDKEFNALNIATLKGLSDGKAMTIVKDLVGTVGDWNIFKNMFKEEV